MNLNRGNIPVLSISAANLPEAWEKAMLEVWYKGVEVKTDYDKPEDPPSKDATVIISVDNPFNEPRIHKNFPGGPEELEAYRQEVVLGIHNHWIKPEEGKWTYTYNQRIFAYIPAKIEEVSGGKNVKYLKNEYGAPIVPINQIDYIVSELARQLYTRRAQAITWMPTMDPETYDPPCLQRLWFRILKNEEDQLVLNMNSHWRSRDLYKAWFMNVYALTDLMKSVADQVSVKIGKEVKVGRYVDISDSLHIYGSYFQDVIPQIQKMEHSSYLGRSWRSDEEAFAFMIEEAKKKLSIDPDHYANGKG